MRLRDGDVMTSLSSQLYHRTHGCDVATSSGGNTVQNIKWFEKSVWFGSKFRETSLKNVFFSFFLLCSSAFLVANVMSFRSQTPDIQSDVDIQAAEKKLFQPCNFLSLHNNYDIIMYFHPEPSLPPLRFKCKLFFFFFLINERLSDSCAIMAP